MAAAKKLSQVNNLSGTERKVWDALPVSDSWNISQITTELARYNGTTMAKNSVERCVKNLLDMGLAKEIGIRQYRKVALKEVPKAVQPEEESGPTPQQEGRLEGGSAIASLERLSEKILNLADEVEDCVRQLKKEQKEKEAKFEKLSALASLIKEL